MTTLQSIFCGIGIGLTGFFVGRFIGLMLVRLFKK